MEVKFFRGLLFLALSLNATSYPLNITMDPGNGSNVSITGNSNFKAKFHFHGAGAEDTFEYAITGFYSNHTSSLLENNKVVTRKGISNFDPSLLYQPSFWMNDGDMLFEVMVGNLKKYDVERIRVEMMHGYVIDSGRRDRDSYYVDFRLDHTPTHNRLNHTSTQAPNSGSEQPAKAAPPLDAIVVGIVLGLLLLLTNGAWLVIVLCKRNKPAPEYMKNWCCTDLSKGSSQEGSTTFETNNTSSTAELDSTLPT